jgi:hypothetical protein
VLFSLVQLSTSERNVERAVARRAPLKDFPEGSAKRRLIDALLDPSARLLVADATSGSAATVRLAHEALVSEWRMAADYVAANAEALKTRRNVEEHYMRWQTLANQGAGFGGGMNAWLTSPIAATRARFGGEHRLLADVDLTDARRLLRDYREELAPDLVAYIERSIAQDRRRRRGRFRAVSAVAAIMSVLAIGAGYEARLEAAQRNAALEAQLRALTQTAAGRLNGADVSGASGIIVEVLQTRGVYRNVPKVAVSCG